MISIEPRGDDLGAVTPETRSAAELAALGGYITQVWTWRGGEAVVLREWPRSYERWSVIVRRGLRRGQPRQLHVESIAAALGALGVRFRMHSGRRRSVPTPSSKAGMRRRLLPGVHRRGNNLRTLRARSPRRHWRQQTVDGSA